MPTLEEFKVYVRKLTEMERAAGKETMRLEVPQIAEHYGITELEASELLRDYMLYLTMRYTSVNAA